MSEPWIGDKTASDMVGRCSYSLREDMRPCGAAATVHVLSESAISGLVGLLSCDEHAAIARSAGPYLGEHPFGRGCRAPVASWGTDGCEVLPPGGAA